MQENQETKTVLPFEGQGLSQSDNPCIFKPDVTSIFKKIGLNGNFLSMSHHLFKKADIVSELVPSLFPFAMVKEKRMHLFYMDTKHNFENFIVSRRKDEKIVDILYFFNNGQPLKISVNWFWFREDEVAKLNYENLEDLNEYSEVETDEFNVKGHVYQYHISDDFMTLVGMSKEDIGVMVNQQAQTVAVMLLMINEGYCLHSELEGLRVRTKNNFKAIGTIDLVCRVNGTYTSQAYPWFNEVDWTKKKILHERDQENG